MKTDALLMWEADRSEGGEAHVAEWRRAGAKRVLGDVGRGGGSSAEVERSAADGMSAEMPGRLQQAACGQGMEEE